MKRYNKASTVLIAGAIVTLVAGFVTMSPEVQGSAQTIITAILVAIIGNRT